MTIELRTEIQRIFSEVFISQNPDGKRAPEISDEMILLESGLDSLSFAILVTRLEEELGYDPFTLSTTAYYPKTFGEFVHFYQDNRP